MAVYVTPQKEIDAYFASDRMGQSSLKRIAKGLDYFLNKYGNEEEGFQKEKEYFIVGSAVDCILTGEEGEFEKQYYVSNLKNKPSEVLISITEKIYESYENDDKILEDFGDLIFDTCRKFEYQNRYGKDAMIKNVVSSCSEYFEELKSVNGRKMLSKDQNELIENITQSLKTNPLTAKYFSRTPEDNIDIYYQKPVFFEINGVECKALFDVIIVEKDDEGLPMSFRPLDLKTMYGNTLDFLSRVKSLRYDVQASYYNAALIASGNSFLEELGVNYVYLEPFRFIVESNTKPGKPLIYEVSQSLLDIGRYGRPALYVNVDGTLTHYPHGRQISPKIMGFVEMLGLYSYYSENEFKEEKIVTLNDGVIPMNWDYIGKL